MGPFMVWLVVYDFFPTSQRFCWREPRRMATTAPRSVPASTRALSLERTRRRRSILGPGRRTGPCRPPNGSRGELSGPRRALLRSSVGGAAMRRAEVGKENGEAREAMGPIGALYLLRLDHLLALRVPGLAVVRSVVIVNGDVRGRGREEGSDLATEGEGDGTLGLPESEVLEDPSSRSIGAAATALGASGVDGGARGGRPKEEVGAVAEGGAAEGSGEGALQEGVEPDQRGRADLSVREDPRCPPLQGQTPEERKGRESIPRVHHHTSGGRLPSTGNPVFRYMPGNAGALPEPGGSPEDRVGRSRPGSPHLRPTGLKPGGGVGHLRHRRAPPVGASTEYRQLCEGGARELGDPPRGEGGHGRRVNR